MKIVQILIESIACI